MTREEAIETLGHVVPFATQNGEKIAEAMDMAIEALSAEAESDDLIIKGAKGIKDGLYNIKDGKLFQYMAKGGTVRTYPIATIDYAPTPFTIKTTSADRPKGEWKTTVTGQPYCSNCEYVFGEDEEFSPFWDYCPMCGARMENK